MTKFCLLIETTRFTDDHNPGLVECQFLDASGRSHTFIEKIPVVTAEDIWADSTYPCEGSINCEIVKQWEDAQGRTLAEIHTSSPWGIESSEGKTSFVVLASQIKPC